MKRKKFHLFRLLSAVRRSRWTHFWPQNPFSVPLLSLGCRTAAPPPPPAPLVPLCSPVGLVYRPRKGAPAQLIEISEVFVLAKPLALELLGCGELWALCAETQSPAAVGVGQSAASNGASSELPVPAGGFKLGEQAVSHPGGSASTAFVFQ